MRFVPGPDLPTGGKIIGLDGVRDAYESGRGSFRMRATTRIESVTARRKGIVVTELPYGVGTERVIAAIKKLVQTKKLQGIADVKDLTDREKGLRLVIEVKNGFHPEAILEQLFKSTPMEESFGINAVALVDGQPRTLGLKEMLEVFLEHRFDVVRRRSTYRRGKAADRLHLVEGLLLAIIDIDEVIQLIRSSDNAEQARGAPDRRLRPHRDPGQLHPRHAAAPADEVLQDRARQGGRRAASARSRSSTRSSATTPVCGRSSPTSWPTSRRPTARRVARSCWSPPARPPPRRPRRSRSPTTRATCSCPPPACSRARRPHGSTPPGDGGSRTRHDVIVSAVTSTARGEVGVVTSAGRVVKLGVLDLPTLPDHGQPPQPAGRRAGR